MTAQDNNTDNLHDKGHCMTQTIHPAAQTGFASAAELYQHARPTYPAEITNWLTDHLQIKPQHRVLDLGAGTGKFLPHLIQVTQQVCAVEPIAEMLEQLKQKYPQVEAVQASSQQLPFPDKYFDAVFCAQSFHWFANAKSLTEIHRVLKPKATLALLWNQRDQQVKWVDALAQLLAQYETDTPRYHQYNWKKVFDELPLFRAIDVSTFAHTHTGSVTQVVSQRLLSTSFIAAMPKTQQQILQQQFEHIVLTHTGKGAQDIIDFPYNTYAYFYEKI